MHLQLKKITFCISSFIVLLLLLLWLLWLLLILWSTFSFNLRYFFYLNMFSVLVINHHENWTKYYSIFVRKKKKNSFWCFYFWSISNISYLYTFFFVFIWLFNYQLENYKKILNIYTKKIKKSFILFQRFFLLLFIQTKGSFKAGRFPVLVAILFY